jgi:hypothetical protein
MPSSQAVLAQDQYSATSKSLGYPPRKIFAGEGGGMSNTGRISIDDNETLWKFGRRE